METRIKYIITAIAILFSTFTLYGQDDTSRFSANLFVGFHGPGYQNGSRPSVIGRFEYAITKSITALVEAGYFRYRITEANIFSSYTIGISGKCFINNLLKRSNRKNDYYASVGLNYFRFNYTNLNKSGQLFVPVRIGVQRMFSAKLGGNLELGFNDFSFLKFGLVWKF